MFKDMGTGLVYLPTLYINEKNIPHGVPFILEDDGALLSFPADTSAPITVRLNSTTRRNQKGSKEGIERSFLKEGTVYELFYYDYGWQSIGKAMAADKPLIFENVPSDALYWLVAEGSDREERIFSLENGKQVWW